jgi:hypothetical protein
MPCKMRTGFTVRGSLSLLVDSALNIEAKWSSETSGIFPNYTALPANDTATILWTQQDAEIMLCSSEV